MVGLSFKEVNAASAYSVLRYVVSTPQIPDRACLVISVLNSETEVLSTAKNALIEAFGPIGREIGPLEFKFTTFYDQELGPEIRRWLWAFEKLVDRGELASIKCLTNRLEQEYTDNGKRRFNLDPGLLTLENFILATGKNRAHRIYLEQGIFGDLTLVFQKGSYRPLEWTYPDYADPNMIRILNTIRENHKLRLVQIWQQTNTLKV